MCNLVQNFVRLPVNIDFHYVCSFTHADKQILQEVSDTDWSCDDASVDVSIVKKEGLSFVVGDHDLYMATFINTTTVPLAVHRVMVLQDTRFLSCDGPTIGLPHLSTSDGAVCFLLSYFSLFFSIYVSLSPAQNAHSPHHRFTEHYRVLSLKFKTRSFPQSQTSVLDESGKLFLSLPFLSFFLCTLSFILSFSSHTLSRTINAESDSTL